MNAGAPNNADIAEIGQRAAEAQDRLKHVSATATSADGAVTVTVNTAGALQQLAFGPRADELPRAALAASVVTTAHRAQVQAAQQLTAIMAPLIGENSDAMKFLEEQIPAPEVEEEPPPAEPRRQFFDRDEEVPPPARPGPPAPPAPPVPPRPPRPTRPPAGTTDDDDYYNGGSFLGRGN
ncbi:YbaB/EbfC family nucleoid-associated protein [Amycolatopsis sp. PS_44_ISF1]|uniref:YbaB/EbfC family nucleoid-associated protein n=1 Tax=Amycolatopsis sp. PS_44_ISF1 TaxID=2974917 RepID=UPI0028E07716|nr:YbaB/EbfC family nucleoid-associated protein [Amycolatopsis sp. PS_44_ISF1]MDT8914616.1 YbaB/EbfC family nucleoid-associated protein [Amycolatopsis sp. PS_44_ISF1]